MAIKHEFQRCSQIGNVGARWHPVYPVPTGYLQHVIIIRLACDELLSMFVLLIIIRLACDRIATNVCFIDN